MTFRGPIVTRLDPSRQPERTVVESLVLTTLRGQDKLPNRQQDWPVPRAYAPIQQSWTFTYSKELIGRDTLPNRQQDWPNPRPVTWYRDWFAQFALFNSGVVQQPFNQYIWPNPSPRTWYQSWTQILSPGALLAPFRQSNWSNPPRTSWYQFWSWSPEQTEQRPIPFNQFNWPNPLPKSWYQTWTQGLSSGALLPPFRQQDWPVPKAQSYWDRFWAWLGPQETELAVPFRQLDWPLPRGSIPAFISWIFSPQIQPVVPPPFVPPPPKPAVYDSFALWSPRGMGGRRTRTRSWTTLNPNG